MVIFYEFKTKEQAQNFQEQARAYNLEVGIAKRWGRQPKAFIVVGSPADRLKADCVAQRVLGGV